MQINVNLEEKKKRQKEETKKKKRNAKFVVLISVVLLLLLTVSTKFTCAFQTLSSRFIFLINFKDEQISHCPTAISKVITVNFCPI